MAAQLHLNPQDVSAVNWEDWKWQQRNAVRTADALLRVYPGLGAESVAAIRHHANSRRLQITPYYLTLIRRTPGGGAPVPDDPMWRQVAPVWESDGDGAPFYYDGSTENWELPDEMVTPIAQHKYDNRVIIRYGNVCHAYCQFCYEALRTLERHSTKPTFNSGHWLDTLDYLKRHSEVEEVILSGGEPLMHSDEQLTSTLSDLRALERPLAIRIHTRSLTFNPFRVTPALAKILRAAEVTAVGLHVSHPHELTPSFMASLGHLREAVPIMFANIPLLRGVNANADLLHELCMRLYRSGVSAGYLYHFMPHSPGAGQYATPIWTGVEVLRQLKRRVSNLAVPEYVLPHATGKYTMPLAGPGETVPEIVVDESGNRSVRFVNWRGELVSYPEIDHKSDR